MRRVVPLAAVAALLSGCAGSAPTREEFTADANRVCREHAKRIAEERRPGALILFADYTAKVLPLLRKQRDEVAELDRTPDVDVEPLLERWDEVLDALERIDRAGNAGEDIGIVMGLRTANAAGTKADAVARRIDVDDCVGFNPVTRTTG